MVTIVDDIRERIALAGLGTGEFLELAEILLAGCTHRNAEVREVCERLMLRGRYILDMTEEDHWQVTLYALTWQDIFVLSALAKESLTGLAAGEHRRHAQAVLAALNAAVESDLRSDTPSGHTS